MIPTVQSAGGLVVTAVGSDLQGLFVSQQRNHELQIPKGMLEPGESVQMAALREVEEESGCRASLITLLDVGEWTYEYQGKPFREVCTFFVMATPDVVLGPHDSEFEWVEWIPLLQAARKMRYALERDLVLRAISLLGPTRELPIVHAHGLWGESASGRASWTSLHSGSIDPPDLRSRILFRDELHPRDAPQLQFAAGIVAERGGPSSHLAVVAAGMRIPSISGISFTVIDGLCHLESGAVLREGSFVRIDAETGTLWAQFAAPTAMGVTLPTKTVNTSFQKRLAEMCVKVGLVWPGNYKFFKRDLAARFFPTPLSIRLYAGWTVESALSHREELGVFGVRISVFPEDIACHAVSVLLSPNDSEARVQLQELDSSSSCEIFVQQSPDQLAFRCVLADGRVQVEAGVGQAMYIFESERGRWATSQCELSITGALLGSVSGNDVSTSSALSHFIGRHGSELVCRIAGAAAQIGAPYLAVEGYFNLTTGHWVVVDLDLPEDRFLMDE